MYKAAHNHILVEKKNQSRLQNGLCGMFDLTEETNTHLAVILKSHSTVKQSARHILTNYFQDYIIFRTITKMHQT